MAKIKRMLGKMIMLLLVCFVFGTTVKAQDTISSEVWIEIEKSKVAQLEGVQTGDGSSMILSAAGVVGAVIVGIFCAKKKWKKGVVSVAILFLSLFCMNASVHASESNGNVNVTIPSRISVIFDETGENHISDFKIDNQLLVPIVLDKVHVTEHNDWSLCEAGSDILVNTKKLAFVAEKQYLKQGENLVNIAVDEQASKLLDIHIERGAWTVSQAEETALQLEFQYELGRKQFNLQFDANGSNEKVPSQKVYNGDTVTLPVIKREGYEFAGWEDKNGNIYTETFIMPIGDTVLKAKWKEIVTYALYLEEDNSLRFVRSAEVLTVGSTYDDTTVTKVFTDFEEETFTSEQQVPWYDGHYYNNTIVKKVIVEDEIKPKCTAHWFQWMYDCEYFDVGKIDTSRVTDMSYMFGWGGFYPTSVEVRGVENFDVSNVKNMEYTFAYTGRYASQFFIDVSGWNVSSVNNMEGMFAGAGHEASVMSLGDISRWDVSNVTNMYSMFQQTGISATWYLDLRPWNVANVTSYYNFNYGIYDKVIDPYWVH